MKFRIFAKSRAAFPGMTAACAGNYVIATDARMISFGLDVTDFLIATKTRMFSGYDYSSCPESGRFTGK